MVQRVRKPYRGQSPSSATQLPILTALHAGFSTLFPDIIHDCKKKVNTLFENCVKNPFSRKKGLTGRISYGKIPG